MGVTVRQHDDLARAPLDAIAAFHLHGGAAIQQQVVDDDVVRTGCEVLGELTGRAADAPRRGELAVVEECAFELHNFQNFREHVHGAAKPPEQSLRTEGQGNHTPRHPEQESRTCNQVRDSLLAHIQGVSRRVAAKFGAIVVTTGGNG